MSPVAQDRHIPVLLDEVLAGLAVKEGETHVDGTFGAGGYTRAILGAGAGKVLAFDRDPDAIAEGRALEAESGGRLILVSERFSRMAEALDERGIGAVDGVTLDIGVSSMQLDRADRGFSFQADGPLDMRMEREGESAADFVNNADEAEIADVLHELGEEPRARRVARAIVAARPITRTGELADVVRRSLGYRAHDKKDPATRTLQAIRIHLNREIEELEEGLAAAEQVLRPGGAAGGGFVPLARGPYRETVPEGAERSHPVRFAPSARSRRGPGSKLRGGRQAGTRGRGRTRAQSPVALGHAARRAPHICFSLVSCCRERSFVMIATRFRSVGWVAGVAVAALGCYLVSQRVATERATVAKVERQILAAKQDIRQLQTEIGTRGRMGQLEIWNGQVLALSAPKAGQFLESEVRLASLNQAPLPLDKAIVESHGAVRQASFEATAKPEVPAAVSEQPMLRQATFVKPKGEGMGIAPTKVALLPDDLLGDIGKMAANESGSKKSRQ